MFKVMIERRCDCGRMLQYSETFDALFCASCHKWLSAVSERDDFGATCPLLPIFSMRRYGQGKNEPTNRSSEIGEAIPAMTITESVQVTRAAFEAHRRALRV